MSSVDLQGQLDRLSLSNSPGLDVPQMRKQRSQRFTIPTNGSPVKSRSSAPAVPSLPYQAPPPPVQSQSISPGLSDPYYSFNRNPPAERADSQPTPYPGDEGYPAHLGGGTGFNMSPPQQSQYQPYHPNHIPQHSYGAPVSTSSYASNYVPAPSPGSYAAAYRPPGRQEQSGGGGAGSGGGGMRSGLPVEWMRPTQAPQSYETSYQTGYAALLGRPLPEDEVIPTAIVIKNIPFQVPKEQLLGVMEDLRLPPPFAFNYHYDNGQFRGLAFANFRAAHDAALTVSALNGFDLQGRKLRTEFKKVLKEGEKERIERDKAIKRMRSTRELSGIGGGGESLGPPAGWNRREASAPGGYPMSHSSSAPISGGGQDEEDYGRLVQGQYSTAYGGAAAGGQGARSFGQREYVPAPVESVYSQAQTNGYGTSPPSDVGTSISARMANTSSGSGSEASATGQASELNLNDPQALEIYSRVLIFKDDSLRDELAFARSLSALQRRTVHLVAKKLGLEHRSVEQGDDRHVVVFKGGAGPPLPTLSTPEPSHKSLRHSASTLGRSSSRDVLSSYLSPDACSSPNSSAALRGKKSMPDIRGPSFNSNTYSPSSHYHYHQQPQHSSSSSSPSHQQQQQQQQQQHYANQRRSNLNLREGFATVGTAARSRPSVQGIFQANNFFESTNAGQANSANTHASTGSATQYYSSDASSSPSLSLSLNSRGGAAAESSATSEEGSAGPTGAGGAGGPFVVRQPRGPGEEARGFGGSWRGGSPERNS